MIGILYPIIIWSRVLLEKHTLAQAISGGVQGYFLTVLEMYLFSFILNLPLANIVSLNDSILYILAIIATPVILGVLSYTNRSINLFIILELVLLVIFIALMPFNISVVFVIVSVASILINYSAGHEFVWFRVLNSS